MIKIKPIFKKPSIENIRLKSVIFIKFINTKKQSTNRQIRIIFNEEKNKDFE